MTALLTVTMRDMKQMWIKDWDKEPTLGAQQAPSPVITPGNTGM